MLQVFRAAANIALRSLLPEKYKEKHELEFWRGRHAAESGKLSNSHFEKYYTTFFDIDPAFYTGKRILDIGCGPRGSLEWADMAAERVGLDSLAKEYMKLGADKHKMRYVDSGAENIPFPQGHFDAAFSFNSLDHVRDLDKTVAEIKRIVKPGGLFLLITELGHEPTPTEPQTFSFEILDRFTPEFTLVSSVAFQMQNGRVYESIQAGQIYDRDNPPPGRAILCAKFERKKSSH